jgi:hypothetical protein
MRLSARWIVPLAPVVLGVACNTVSPEDCWVNTSGGLGGSDPIPIGAGVGATSSGDFASPPEGPLDVGGVANPCVDTGTDLGTYIRCRGMDPMTCEALCYDIGARCAALKPHPYGSMGGDGKLKQCQSNTLNHTCTYCYINGDSCTFLYTPLTPKGVPFCSYTGGKGCD